LGLIFAADKQAVVQESKAYSDLNHVMGFKVMTQEKQAEVNTKAVFYLFNAFSCAGRFCFK
jgi:hypothetical protein